MSDLPEVLLGDAVGLVDAFRRRELTPTEALDACLGAIEGSDLNAFSFVDADRAREAAARADVSLPLGGVPIGIKELDKVEGWPDTEGSLVFKDRVGSYTTTFIQRILDAGAVPVGLTTASEFGGLNVSITRLNGETRNGWGDARTAGGSSGGSAAAVCGGLVPIASGGDGGGSIRIPAGFCGLFGLKATYGRIPKGPNAGISPMTAVLGCLSRTVRDTARWFDIANGFDTRDPLSLPRVEGWEAGLGSRRDALRGRRAAIIVDVGATIVRPEVEALVRESAEALAAEAGLVLVDASLELPGLALDWALTNIVADLLKELGDRYPGCEDLLTTEIAFGLQLAGQLYNAEVATRAEVHRREVNERMAALFDEVDFVFAATNPDVAFPSHVTLSSRVGDRHVGPENNGSLTMPANLYGNPGVSIPVGLVDGLPVGLQVMARHHAEPLLLELSHVAEQTRPWPLVAPGSPR